MKKLLMTAIIFSSLFTFISCGSKDNAEPAKEKETKPEEKSESENPNTATLTDEQIKSIGIEIRNY